MSEQQQNDGVSWGGVLAGLALAFGAGALVGYHVRERVALERVAAERRLGTTEHRGAGWYVLEYKDDPIDNPRARLASYKGPFVHEEKANAYAKKVDAEGTWYAQVRYLRKAPA